VSTRNRLKSVLGNLKNVTDICRMNPDNLRILL